MQIFAIQFLLYDVHSDDVPTTARGHNPF